jgi:hypothetical protein
VEEGDSLPRGREAYHGDMSRLCRRWPASGDSDRSAAADLLVREEPDEEEEDEDDDKEADDDDDNGDGYSE